MGIEGINPLLKKIIPEVFISVPLKNFENKKIAIDAFNIIYKTISNVSKNYITRMKNPSEVIDRNKIRISLVAEIMNFNVKLLNHKITPIWVFDGQAIVHKKSCNEKRRKLKEDKKNKIEEKRKLIDETHLLLLEKQDIEELRKMLLGSIYPTTEDYETIKNVFISIGIPVLNADGDAEKLCSALNISKKVSAVWSKDTDNYALGTPTLIYNHAPANFLPGGKREECVEIIQVSSILEYLSQKEEKEINQEFLLDLCITLGTDFNNRIPKIGETRGYELMRTYGSIDLFPQNLKKIELDLSILNHIEVRELFKYEKPIFKSNQLKIDWDKYLIGIDDILEKYGILNRELHLEVAK